VFDIKAADYLPKPDIASYRKLVNDFAIDPSRAVMFEDLPRNLIAAAELGMTTVWVRQDCHPDGAHAEQPDMAAIHHVTDDLAGWLEARLP
jgi:putative hydrolase of the HAD superfamily